MNMKIDWCKFPKGLLQRKPLLTNQNRKKLLLSILLTLALILINILICIPDSFQNSCKFSAVGRPGFKLPSLLPLTMPLSTRAAPLHLQKNLTIRKLIGSCIFCFYMECLRRQLPFISLRGIASPAFDLPIIAFRSTSSCLSTVA